MKPTPVNHSCCLRRGSRRGFTLVELLVVIGIIAIMIGILLPTLARARESARQIKCMSNMRQLSTAVVMFAGEHKSWMPGRAGSGFTRYGASGQPVGGGTDPRNVADWIAWQRVTDLATGGPGNGSDQNISYSALAPYLGSKPREHDTANNSQAANTMFQNLDDVFRCPSDNLLNRPKAYQGTGTKAYRYSYSISDHFANPVQQCKPAPPAGVPAGARNGFVFNGKISSIRTPSEKVLFICEDEQTIDDGIFSPQASQWATNAVNAVASRHENKYRTAKVSATDLNPNVNSRGNVGFCDGHAEFMSRKEALSQRYSGNWNPDPKGF